MISSNNIVFNQIKEMISKGQDASLLQKLEFDITITNSNELSNYITILLTLIEQSTYSAQASDLLVKKIILNAENFEFLKNNKEGIYYELYRVRIWPFVGLSEIIRRLIGSIIYDEEKDADIIAKIPSKEFLIEFNIGLIKDFFTVENFDIETGTRLLYNCWNNIEMPDRKVKLSEKAIEIYKNVLINNILALDDYLHLFLRFYWYGGSREWFEGKLIVPEPFYTQIFGSIREFLDFIDKYQENEHRQLTNNINRLYQDIRKFIRRLKMQKNVTYDDPEVGLDLVLHYNLYKELFKK